MKNKITNNVKTKPSLVFEDNYTFDTDTFIKKGKF